MPVGSQISLTSGSIGTLGNTSNNMNLIYFIVSLVIQTEYAANQNQNLTQKQITELFNIGCTIQQMYNLTVAAGFADSATFLNSIPLNYIPVSSSVLDEIIALGLNDTNGNLLCPNYVKLITYKNTPGPNCWAFGSLQTVVNSLNAAANSANNSQQVALTSIAISSTVDNGNSLLSLWDLANDGNTAVSPFTVASIQPAVQNYMLLNNFLNAFSTHGWGAGDTNKTYANFMIAKIPFEVLLCCEEAVIIAANSNNFPAEAALGPNSNGNGNNAKKMNYIWNFLTNNNTGSVSIADPSTIGSTVTNIQISNAVNFSTAVRYLSALGYSLDQVLNVDTTLTVSTTFANEVSQVVLQIVANPSLYSKVSGLSTSIYGVTGITSNNNYLISLIKQLNSAIAYANGLGALAASSGASAYTYNTDSFSYSSTNQQVNVNGASTGTLNTTYHCIASPSATQYAAVNAVNRAYSILKLALANQDLVSRMSLNGYYPLSTIKLTHAQPFIKSTDNVYLIINFINDTAGLTASVQTVLDNTTSKQVTIPDENLYLLNKLMAVQKYEKVTTMDSTVTVSASLRFDLVSLMNLTTGVTNTYSSTQYLMLGNGSAAPRINGNATSQNSFNNQYRSRVFTTTATYGVSGRSAIEFAISAAFTASTDSSNANSDGNLVSLVNGLGDYAVENSIGKISSKSSVITNIDTNIFVSGNGLILRRIKAIGTVSPIDYATMATVMTQLVKTVELNTMLAYPSTNKILLALGGDMNVAIAAWALSLTNTNDIANFLAWLNTGASIGANTSGTGGSTPYGSGSGTQAVVNLTAQLLLVADALPNFNLGSWIMLGAQGTSASNMGYVYNLVNNWVNNVITINSTTGVATNSNTSSSLDNIISTIFFAGVDTLTNTTVAIQNQIIIRKVVALYNNLSNKAVTMAYQQNIILGFWAQYVPLAYLAYTNGVYNAASLTATVPNYDINLILNIAQTLSIYDYSSGSSTGIIVRELITAEDLVQAGILSANKLPSYITYTSTSSSGSITTSQANNLRLIVAVCKAMDQASKSLTYTTYLANAVLGAQAANVGGISSGGDMAGIYYCLVGATPPAATLGAGLTTNFSSTNWSTSVPTEQLFDALAISSRMLSQPSIVNVQKTLDYVLKQFNADGTPKYDPNPNPYY
jgi:hypothetical protein